MRTLGTLKHPRLPTGELWFLATTPIATTAFTSARNFTSPSAHSFHGLNRGELWFLATTPIATTAFTSAGDFTCPAAHGFHGLNRGELWFLRTTHIETTAFTSARSCTPPCIPTAFTGLIGENYGCLLYTSPSPRDATLSRMPSSA